MIPVPLDTIAREVRGAARNIAPGTPIDRICTDSRGASPGALFVALAGGQTDGHRFLADAFRNGASGAIVSSDTIRSAAADPDWPLIVTDSPLRSLQLLAKWYRRGFMGRVIAVTGSNGKTVVKDALGALLSRQGVTTSPGSYNSQMGLPLAVLAHEKEAPLAVLEAGVSAPGEMRVLEEVAAPDYGILTNIGMAHLASFGGRDAIAREKMALFQNIPANGWVLLPHAEPLIAAAAAALRCRVYRIGGDDQVLSLETMGATDGGQAIALTSRIGGRVEVLVNTRSPDIVADLHIAATAAFLLGTTLDEIGAALDGYTPTPTRTEVWSSAQGVRIVNDAYTSDPISIHNALRTAALGAPRTGRRIFAFAGAKDLGQDSHAEQRQIGALAADCGYSHMFLVGEGNLKSIADGFQSTRADGTVVSVKDPSELKEQLRPMLRWGDTVLFKGPRNAGMVAAARELAGSIAPRAMWVDLAAIAENVARFRRHTGGKPRIMAVLKALAYGTEIVHLASLMVRLGIHHIGVSTTDEGVLVRKTGVAQDIYVFMPNPSDVESLVRYRLTPILYDADQIAAFDAALTAAGHVIDVHLKVNTGMNRLGVEPDQVAPLAERFRTSATMRLTGICTHFASADDPAQDDGTLRQIACFDRAVADLRAAGFDDLLIHAANTAGTVRFPQAHYNMVRIGLGLYGIYGSPALEEALPLSLAVGVTSQIVRIAHLKQGESLGYGRPYIAPGDRRIGVIPFGYDDGIKWQFAATGSVMIDGQLAPIVGRVSMDQMQVDITGIPHAAIGMPALIFGSHDGYAIRPEVVADQLGTIPHAMLVGMGRRVTRIYIEP